MTNPLVSVVAICWNRKKDILETLEGIYKTDYENIEVIIVDNASTDGSSEAIEDKFPMTKVIKMYKNSGIEAYNIGFENAKGKYIVILDDDSFPAENTISRMVKKFEKNPNLGVVAFDVRNYYRYDEVSQDIPDEIEDVISESDKYYLSFNGAGAGIRTNLFKEIGYYPEEFFLYWNEQDTAFRVWDKGYTIQNYADCVAYHRSSPKNRESRRAPFYYTRNMFWVIWKNLPLYQCILKTIQFIYLCIYFSFEQHTTVYMKAMLSAFIYMDKPLSKRKVVSDKVWQNLRMVHMLSFQAYR